MTKRKEQIEKSSGNSNTRGGRGGRGGAVSRGGGKPIGRSYHAAMQTVSCPQSIPVSSISYSVFIQGSQSVCASDRNAKDQESFACCHFYIL